MARTIPTAFSAIDPQELGTTRAIDDTEQTLARNGHYLYGYHRPTTIRTTFRSDSSAGAGVQPYVQGRSSASAEVSALWCIEPPGLPFTQFTIYALVANTSTTDAATLRFDIASDPYPGTSVDISINANTSQWTVASNRLTIDNTQTTDTIRMWAINGASGELQVHHVMLIPQEVTTLPAGVNTQNDHDFVPIDDDEVAQDAPLSVRLRTRQHGNLYHVWRNRPGMCIGWSEDTHFRAGSQAFSTTSSTYEEVIRVPLYVPRGVTAIRWAVVGTKTGTGVGRVRLRTASMDTAGTAAQVVDVSQSYTSPYTSNLTTYADSGQADLTCKSPDAHDVQQDELIIDLQSDGSARVDLISVTAWFEVP